MNYMLLKCFDQVDISTIKVTLEPILPVIDSNMSSRFPKDYNEKLACTKINQLEDIGVDKKIR